MENADQRLTRRSFLRRALATVAIAGVNLPLEARTQGDYSSEQSLVLEDGTRIWYEKRAGKPNLPPIVFIHGNGQNHTTGNVFLKRMGEIGHTLVAYDLPGNGKSEPYRDGKYSMQRSSDTLDKVISSSGVEKPILVGHSYGGMIALQYAVEHPEKVTSLVLAGSSDVNPAKINKTLDAMVSDVKRKAIEGGKDAGKVYPFDANPDLIDEEVHKISLAYTHPQALLGHLNAVSSYDVRDRLLTLNVQVLILRGEKDSIITAEMTEAMSARLKNHRFRTVYGAGHNFVFQKPRLFIGLVESNLGYLKR